MDPERYRIQSDLRGLLEGEVRCDDVFVQLYASDASLYEIRPRGVVRPRGVNDVVALVQYAAENNLPLHPRGAGTGIAGESIGAGLIVDFSHSMRRIVSIDDDTVRVQPGVVHAQLNRQLAELGRQFGPDPATRSVTTMGSVLALDGAGSHWLKYGSARRHIVSMQVVLADGTVIEAGRHRIPDNPVAGTPTRHEALVRRLSELLQREERTIAVNQPKALVNRAGYQLHDVLADGYLDLAKLLVGSEGTLAMITEATVRTSPLPLHRGVALLFFDRLESAARGALEVSLLDVASCDLMDRRLLSIAREIDDGYERLIPRDAEALLLIEIQSDSRDDLRDRLQNLVMQLQRRKRLAFASVTTMEREERDYFWRLMRRVVPMLYQLKGPSRPVPFVEDIAVPPETLPDFLVRLQNVLKTHEVTAALFGHAGHGQLHIRPFLDIASAADIRKMQDLAADLYTEVMSAGGTISGEHGCGLSRTWYVRRQYGPLYDVFREVKRIFDPQNIFNPGKVVADLPPPLTKNLRPVEIGSAKSEPPPSGGLADVIAPPIDPADADTPPAVPFEKHLIWQSDDALALEARNCNGCGRCRTQAPDARMCPIFRITPAEEASPRAKANLVRAVLTGQLKAEELTTDHTKALIDTCVNCHQCRLECPAGVDIPKLVTEARSQYVVNNGLTQADWFLSRLDRVARWASMLRPLANWSLANRQMRWLLEKTIGIAQGRKLPRVAARSFLREAMRRKLTRSSKQTGRKVLYFVDTYANWFDVQLAEACVAVLEHNGASVFVHPEQLPSGMAQITLGDVERVKPQARRNVALLADAVRQGYEIVCTEPSAALALAHEYLNLIEDDDARLVAEHTHEACTYLWQLHRNGQMELDLRPVNVSLGYHTPCHLRALPSATPGEQLLRLVPGLSVQSIERGCSGMAGTYGMKRENYRASLRAGWGLITALRDPEIQYGATECSACRIQMEQGTTKPTIHPLKILAYSYGLMPEIASLLGARSEELVVT